MLLFKQIRTNFNKILNEMDEIHDDNSRDTTDKLNNLKENSKVQKYIDKVKKMNLTIDSNEPLKNFV